MFNTRLSSTDRPLLAEHLKALAQPWWLLIIFFQDSALENGVMIPWPSACRTWAGGSSQEKSEANMWWSPKEYYRPKTISHALRLLVRHEPRAAVLAGGTRLVAEHDPGIEVLLDLSALNLEVLLQPMRDNSGILG